LPDIAAKDELLKMEAQADIKKDQLPPATPERSDGGQANL